MEKIKLTKNRFYNLIMHEVDLITSRSNDVEQMKFKLSALPSNVLKAVDKFEKENK